MQDIFFRLWQRRKELELRYSLSTYLAVAVRYRITDVMDHRHRKRNKVISLLDYDSQTSPSPEELIFEKKLREQIEASIKRLPEKCRIIFRMSREQGLTYKQISGELVISEKTVEAHMSKALKDMRNNLTVVVPAFILCFLEQDKFRF